MNSVVYEVKNKYHQEDESQIYGILSNAVDHHPFLTPYIRHKIEKDSLKITLNIVSDRRRTAIFDEEYPLPILIINEVDVYIGGDSEDSADIIPKNVNKSMKLPKLSICNGLKKNILRNIILHELGHLFDRLDPIFNSTGNVIFEKEDDNKFDYLWNIYIDGRLFIDNQALFDKRKNENKYGFPEELLEKYWSSRKISHEDIIESIKNHFQA